MRYWLIAACAGLGGASASGQTLMTVSHWLIYDDVQETITFEIEYNRVPDFHSVNAFGDQADSFQIHLDTRPGNTGMGGTSPLPWETIVRGEEIHSFGKIPVRDHVHGPSSQPGSGGWGPIVTLLDFNQAGNRLTFEASFDVLNTPDGRFNYELDLYEYGAWTGTTYIGTSVPGPASAWVVVAAAALVVPRRRRG